MNRKKYELLPEEGTKLWRLRALRDFGDVKAGDLGGFIGKESNLSHVGKCWVHDNAMVFGDAEVSGSAEVHGSAEVYDDAKIYGNATVYGNAEVLGDAQVYGNADVYDNAWVLDDARVYDDAEVYGSARVSGNAEVYGNAWVLGDARVFGNAKVYGKARVCGDAEVYGSAEVFDTKVYGDAEVCGDEKARQEYEPLFVESGAVKHDSDKPPLSLLPKSFLDGVATAFSDGQQKYGRYNYLKGMDWDRMIDAALRHLTAFNDGEDLADDSGLNHLWHAGACIAILCEYYAKNIGNDSRYKKETL